MQVKVGDIVTATITGIQPYGAFCSLSDGVTGLIHISEISEGFVRDVHQFVEVNESVSVKVIDFDTKTNQARLSLKALKSSRKDKINMHSYKKGEQIKLGFKSIEEALPIWIEERMAEIESNKKGV